MKVVQVNAGPLKPLVVEGHTISTGFYKSPRSGPVAVSRQGLEGDTRVAAANDPNRAVFLYQVHYYDHWRQELKRDVPHGMFGENISFEGWDDQQFCIGDELQIGSVRLRITQPRHPCIKIGVRMGDPSFPSKYLKALRLGFHCSVVEEGTLQQGDDIRLVHRAQNPLQLHEFTVPIFIPPKNLAGLEKILACAELVPEWRIRVERLWRKTAGRLDEWREYRPLKLTNHRKQCGEVVHFDLESTSHEPLPKFDGGQFLTMRFDIPGESRPAVRTYTIAGRSADGKGYSFAVKRERGERGRPGLVSSHLVDACQAGDLVQALPARGHFVVEPGPRPVVLLSAGIGVTPMAAMFDELKTCPLTRRVFFVHGARNAGLHVLKDKVRQIADGWPQAHLLFKYSQPEPEDLGATGIERSGRITIEDIERLIPLLDADFYVCGPAAFMQEMIPALVARGVSKDRIKFEFFGTGIPLFKEEAQVPPGEPVLGEDGQPIIVTFAKAGVSVPWLDNTPSILALAERSGIRLPYSCRNGLCEVCVCRLDSGEVRHEADIINPPAKDEVMICCAKPATSVMIDA